MSNDKIINNKKLTESKFPAMIFTDKKTGSRMGQASKVTIKKACSVAI